MNHNGDGYMITIDHQYGMWMPVDASENDEDVGLAGLTPQEIGSLRGKMMIQPCMYVYIYIYTTGFTGCPIFKTKS